MMMVMNMDTEIKGVKASSSSSGHKLCEVEAEVRYGSGHQIQAFVLGIGSAQNHDTYYM